MLYATRENRNRNLARVLLTISLLALRIDPDVEGAILPFDATIDLAGVDESRKVEKGEPFGFLFCLHAADNGIDLVELTLVLPPEVDRLGGETHWRGNLGPKEESCLDVALKSRTAMEKWSRPFRAEMKFTYQGMGVVREVKWTDQGLNDSDFVSREK